MTLTCNICLCDIISKPIKFCCRQYYHYECISEWIKTKPSCPICRKDLNYNIIQLFNEINNKFEQISSALRYVYTVPPPPPPPRRRYNHILSPPPQPQLLNPQRNIHRYRNSFLQPRNESENYQSSFINLLNIPYDNNDNRLRRRRNAIIDISHTSSNENSPINIFSDFNNLFSNTCTCSWISDCTCGRRIYN